MARKKREIGDRSAGGHPAARRSRLLQGLLVAGLITFVLLAAIYAWTRGPMAGHPGKPAVATYVGRETCAACHQDQMKLFQGSHHDLAMDRATDETVLGDFNDVSIHHYGVTSRLYRDGDRFMVRTEGPDGEMHDYEISHVFGVEPLQQYMVEFDRPEDAAPNELGRLQVLRLCWDTLRSRWFYLSPPDVDERIAPSDPLHWTGIAQRWNTACADCHSTDVHKNYDLATDTYRTTFHEIDVSCEACHGPGSEHVRLAQSSSWSWGGMSDTGLVRIKGGPAETQIESCAPCHSRRTKICNGFRPGQAYDDHFACQTLTVPIYHADGQIRDEDYVYGSFLQSRMHLKGIRCTDCHDPHSARVRFDDNRLCTSCHQHPASTYDTPAHHHHAAQSPGARCVECHMPSTTYMDVDPRRDHSLRVPRPDLSVELGTPNACSGCHVDPQRLPEEDRNQVGQYLDWIRLSEAGNQTIADELNRVDRAMKEACAQWYDGSKSRSGDTAQSVWYELLARGQSARIHDVAALVQLAQQPAHPGLVRATALEVLADDRSAESLEAALAAVNDDDPKVVAATLRRIEREMQRAMEYFSYGGDRLNRDRVLEPLLKAALQLLEHPVRLVRVSAAPVVAAFPDDLRDQLASSDQRKAFRAAIDEYIASLQLEQDRAAVHVVLGNIYEVLGRIDEAERAYRTAMRLDPNLTGPRSNLAALLESRVRQQQQRMMSQQSGMAASEVQSLVAEMQRDLDEARALRKEEHNLMRIDLIRSRHLPDTHGLHYRFAMSSYLQGDRAAAEEHLREALRQRADNPQYLLALATLYRETGRLDEAARLAIDLVKLDPDHPGYRNLAREIERELGRNVEGRDER